MWICEWQMRAINFRSPGMGSPGATRSQAGWSPQLASGVLNVFWFRSARQVVFRMLNHQLKGTPRRWHGLQFNIPPNLCGGNRFRIGKFLPEYCDDRTVANIQVRAWLTWLTRGSAGPRIYSSTALASRAGHSSCRAWSSRTSARCSRPPSMSTSPLRTRPGTTLLCWGRTHCARSRCRARRACHPARSAQAVLRIQT